MGPQKQIAIFTGYFFPHIGGVEKYVACLSAQLAKKGFKLIIVTNNTENITENELSGNTEIIRFPIFGFSKGRYPVINCFKRTFWQKIKYLKKKNIDFFIINTRFYLTTFVGLIIASHQKKKCAIIEHGTGHLITNSSAVNFAAKLYEHFLTTIVKSFAPKFYGVSAACVGWLEHFNITADGIIYNGVNSIPTCLPDSNFKRDYHIKQGDILITSVSRLIPEKGIAELIQAFELLNFHNDGLHLFIAGDGPMLGFLQKKFHNHPNIHITGRLEHQEVLSLLIESDIVVVPSRYPEGLPTIILEAGLANCAVISTDMGGSREVIIHKDYGIIIPECNVTEMQLAMKELCVNNPLRTSMAKNLHERVVHQFNWEIITETFLLSAFFTDVQSHETR